MRVNAEHQVNLDKLKNDPLKSPQRRMNFGQVVQKHEQKLHGEQVTRLIGNINLAGERLARSRNLRDMAKFKMLVKRFIEEATTSGYALDQSHTWNQFGEGRRLNLVRQIDEELVQLAEQLLDDEKTSIDLLAKIGEIKGLLINLYM